MLLLALLQACDPVVEGPHALAYDGAPDCALADLSKDPPTSFTVEAWLRGDPEAFAAMRPLMLWHNVFELSENAEGQVIFTVGPDGVGASHPFSVMDGVLHHVAGTYDGADGTVRLYVDGAQVGVSGAAAFMGEAKDDQLQVGCAKDETEAFYGVLDELRVSSVVRYTDDFELPSGDYEEDADTMLLFHLDEGTGSTAASAAGGATLSLYDTSWVDSPLGDEG